MNLRRIFHARPCFDAAADIDTERPRAAIACGNVRWLQSARQNQLRSLCKLRRCRPIGRLARAADRAFEQQSCRQRLRQLASGANHRRHLQARAEFAASRRSSISVCKTSGRNTRPHFIELLLATDAASPRRARCASAHRAPARPHAAQSPCASIRRTQSRPRRRRLRRRQRQLRASSVRKF